MTAMTPRVVLVGLESVGKSALFRQLTGHAAGDEQNLRGSTVTVRSAPLRGRAELLVDTPGVRVADDSATTRLALRQLSDADTVLLVARGTHALDEIATLLRLVAPALEGRRAALIITFADRAAPELASLRDQYRATLGLPVALVNARELAPDQRARLLATIDAAAPVRQTTTQPITLLPVVPRVQPPATMFERRLGAWAALAALVVVFALPVYAAYQLAAWAQPLLDAFVLAPLAAMLAGLQTTAPLVYALLLGPYGLLSLGAYSFIWAFPVVVLIGVSVAVTEETGLKDRITAALDPWLRSIGLNGRDLVPVLSGFGCNVVAVFQSRACSSCTRNACVSLIAFGSACSYQIGATLSLFNAAGSPWLFAPYLGILFLVGALHTRLWHGALPAARALPLHERAFLQRPTLRGAWWRVRAVLQQFLLQAMPIFLLICIVGALLAYGGVLDWLAVLLAPLLGLWGLPGAVAPGLLAASIRKDGLLVLNADGGALLAALSTGQLFVLVYLASTLTACLVTLWTIRRELGVGYALTVAGRQALTALASALLLALLVQALSL